MRSSLAVLVALTVLAVPGRAHAQAPTREVIAPAGATIAPTANFSPGVRAGNFLFVTGQLGAGADIGSQTTAALESIKKILEAGGTTMANIVDCTMFMADLADYNAMNDAWRPFFADGQRPARTTVQVAKLLRADGKVEIKCVAFVPPR